jgi:hypothetical protein
MLRAGPQGLRSHGLLPVALGLLVVLGLVDLVVGSVVLVPLFVLAPLIVAFRGAVAETAATATAALAVAVVSGTWNGALGTSGWWVGVLLVTVGGAAATVAAATR